MNNKMKKDLTSIVVNLAKIAWSNTIVRLLVILFAVVIVIAYFGGVTPDKLWNTRQTPPAPQRQTTTPTQAPAPSQTQAAPSNDSGDKVAIGGYNISVAEGENGSTYDREGKFGPAWGYDLNGNGCDTRNDILDRDLQNVKVGKDGCTVLSGTMVNDPYTGKTYDWQRGRNTSMAVQIDHIIPLKYAWMHGADKWDQETREQYANDPDVLVAADGPANAAKGAKGPSQWEPENKGYTCQYAKDWLKIADKYNLSVDKADAEWLSDTISSCK